MDIKKKIFARYVEALEEAIYSMPTGISEVIDMREEEITVAQQYFKDNVKNKKQLETNEESCPHCNASLQGEPIPLGVQMYYGTTHYSRKIGIYSMETDRTTHYQCPDCEQQWKREW
ncbi:hypothetical protein CON01_00365 [Bacillus thuringiensis]|uniref:Uncharacterized protein n=1 Tax=Bacillus thuringiensis TaxID=1428 RepID=A0A9X6U4Y6_BACTU|nr:hypothetical protein [Bacillus thuringiensis]PED16335.1 hypothetical protein CON01_00365 [Bacillus thuringiensis]